MASRSDFEALLRRIIPDGAMRDLGLQVRNRGGVERVTIGESAVSGRVRGKRRNSGFNVRVTLAGAFSCGCPQGRKKQACEHVAALLHASCGFAGSGDSGGSAVTAKKSLEPDPEVFRFLIDLFPGIGPGRAREVARVFRTVPDLMGATERQLRGLPEIGTWAASQLRERLTDYARLGATLGSSKIPRRSAYDEDVPQVPALKPEDAPWLYELAEEPAAGSPTLGENFRVLVQATRAGPVFFRLDPPKDPRARRAIRTILREDRRIHKTHEPAARASTRGVWISGPGEFPRVIGRLEALGVRRESATLVDLPLDGLTLYVDASGRRSRFQPATDGAEEAFPKFKDMVTAAEGYEYDEVNGHHLVLPREYPRLRETLTDLGALLLRKRLRPMREITEWKEPSEEEWSEGTPKIKPVPDMAPFMAETLPTLLKKSVNLFGYQKEGIAFIRACNYIAYIGDEPGLGKTLQAIVSALYVDGRVLVVCPAGARNVWRKEISQHSKATSVVIQPAHANKKLIKNGFGDAKFVIASYDSLLSQRDLVMSEKYDVVILDEAHYVKNKEAERTKAVHEVLRSIKRRILLSGTPVMNRAEELRKQMEFLYPNEWGNEVWFRARFVQPLIHGTPEVRKQALLSLRRYLEGVMLRRRKVDVLKDLPVRHTIVKRVKIPPVWRREYEAEASLLREHVQTRRDTAFGEEYDVTRGHIMTLRQIASNGKGEVAEGYIKDILATPGEKVVVFSVYLHHLEALQKSLEEYKPVSVTGAVQDKQRAEAVRAFQEDDDCRVFLGQIMAAGTALTLTQGRHVVFVDLDWNPANHEQAGDRVHRISQTRECFLHYLVAGNTIDDDVASLLDKKVQDTRLILDGDENAVGLIQQHRQARLVAQLALAETTRLEEDEVEV